jgi:hypothetical protein
MMPGDHNELRGRMSAVAFAITLLILGVWMMLEPDAFDDATLALSPAGNGGLGGGGGSLDLAFSAIWSFPGGVVCVLLAGLIAWKLLFPKREL